jgi:hypothetical protein
MRRVIITADDYGFCDAVNRAIDLCLDAGALRAVCVMPNMARFGDAAGLRKKFPAVPIGVHWTITEGQPVCPASQVASLIGAGGSFLKPAEFRRRWHLRRINPAEVKRELRAQYDRLTALTGPPAFWNTHQNIHVAPGLYGFFVQAGLDLGVPAMRCHRRVLVPRRGSRFAYYARHPWFWLKGLVLGYYCAKARRRGLKMPAGVIVAPGYNKAADIELILGSGRWPEALQLAELVVHPADEIAPEFASSRLTQSRLEEFRVLNDPGLSSRLAEAGVKLVGFEAL